MKDPIAQKDPKNPKSSKKRFRSGGNGSVEKIGRPILIDMTIADGSMSIPENERKIEVQPLNPMVFSNRFSHITEQVFTSLDKKSISSCREVAKSWQESIDKKNILWIAIVQKIGANRAFQWACKKGHTKMTKMLLKKAKEFHLVINARDDFGKTAFIWACENGHFQIVNMLLQKSAESNIQGPPYLLGRTFESLGPTMLIF